LAAVYLLAGPNFFVARVVQCFVTAFSTVLTYGVCKRVYGFHAARWAAFFVAVYVPLILYAVGLMTENISIPLLLLGVWLLLKTDETRLLRHAAACGIVLGAAVLMRPELTFFLPLLLPWLWFPSRDWKKAFVPFAVIVIIVAAMVTPWCVRNYRVTGQFVYLDTRAGYNLYIGYRDGADGAFNMDAAKELANLLVRQFREGKRPNDVVMHNWGQQHALEFMREHPWRAIGLLPLKFAHFWNLEHHLFVVAYSWGYLGPLPAWVLALLLVLLVTPFAALVLLSVAGVALAERWSKGVWLLLLLIGYYTVLHTVIFGEARLHFPLVPFLAILAAGGMETLRGLRARWSSRDLAVRAGVRRGSVAALAVAALFVVVWSFGLARSMPEFQRVLAPGGHRAHLDY
jgi:4-amino-4-deoxy-L-arabinose transferase-like glycosyltransferase